MVIVSACFGASLTIKVWSRADEMNAPWSESEWSSVSMTTVPPSMKKLEKIESGRRGETRVT